MHLIIPFAGTGVFGESAFAADRPGWREPASAAGDRGDRQVAQPVHGSMPRLPNLTALGRMAAWRREVEGDGSEASETPIADPALTLTPPHERVLAAALRLPGGDGLIPWAALQALEAGLDRPGEASAMAWGLLTPCHWRVGAEQVSMVDPAALALDPVTAGALLDTVHPLFEDEGFALHARAGDAWLLAHPSLEDLPCASPDRVIGRNVDLWLGADPRLRRIRRLQAEFQMLLHDHPVNARREAEGLLTVNSFWLSGCGRLPPGWSPPSAVEPAMPVRVDDRLRAPALSGDVEAWVRAFEALDAEWLAPALEGFRRGAPMAVSLCGEAQAITLTPSTSPWWRRIFGRRPRPDPRAWLAQL